MLEVTDIAAEALVDTKAVCRLAHNLAVNAVTSSVANSKARAYHSGGKTVSKSVYQSQRQIEKIYVHFVGAADGLGGLCLRDRHNNAAEQHHSDAGDEEVHLHVDYRCL